MIPQSQFARSITRANAPTGVLQPPTYPVGVTLHSCSLLSPHASPEAVRNQPEIVSA